MAFRLVVARRTVTQPAELPADDTGRLPTLGIFLLIASRNPLAHLSLIWFTVWSSIAHAGIMAAQALENPEHIAHLWGDVPALLAIAALLAVLAPRRARSVKTRGQVGTAFKAEQVVYR
ncbi:MAG TPA: DUF6632 domain-containing protein [Terriglobales bacterium]|nr:DUF6632 domain-containing protein [Terriglobales bacterium]